MIPTPVACRPNLRNRINTTGIRRDLLRKVGISMRTVVHHYAIACIAIGFAFPALAGHPGEKSIVLDVRAGEVFSSDCTPTAPEFELEDASGETVR